MIHDHKTLVEKWNAWTQKSDANRMVEWLEYCDVRDGLPIGTYWERYVGEKQREKEDRARGRLM